MPTVCDIFLGSRKRQPMSRVDEATVTETGLADDRYSMGLGSFSKPVEEGDAGRHMTLIESEAIAAARREFGVDWAGGLHRRNLVTSGVALNDMINRFLKIGDVVLRGERHCPPCRHLEKLTTLEAMRSLASRGGLRTRVMKAGTIRVGDAIEVLERYP